MTRNSQQIVLYFPRVDRMVTDIRRCWSSNNYEAADEMAAQFGLTASELFRSHERFVILDLNQPFTDGDEYAFENARSLPDFHDITGYRFQQEFDDLLDEIPDDLSQDLQIITTLGEFFDASRSTLNTSSNGFDRELLDQPVNHFVDWSLSGYEWNILEVFTGAAPFEDYE